MSKQKLCLLAGSLGLISHLAFFIHGEHHVRAPKTLKLYFVAMALLLILEKYLEGGEWNSAIFNSGQLILSYGFALFISVLTYRSYFHRLHAFPGPRLAKLSKLWNVIRTSKSTNFRLMEEMRRQYGDFVRTGTHKRSQLFSFSKWMLIASFPYMQDQTRLPSSSLKLYVH